jgi:hypothetical protein
VNPKEERRKGEAAEHGDRGKGFGTRQIGPYCCVMPGGSEWYSFPPGLTFLTWK